MINLDQFKEITKQQASVKNNLVMGIMKKDKTEEELKHITEKIKDISMNPPRLTVSDDPSKAVYICHTIDLVISMIAKTWIDVSDITFNSEQDVIDAKSVILERSMNVFNDSDAMIKHIENLQIIIVEILSRGNTKDTPVGNRYSMLFPGELDLLGYIQNVIGYVHFAHCQEPDNTLSGDVNADIQNIIIVDNIFSDITLFDVGDENVSK